MARRNKILMRTSQNAESFFAALGAVESIDDLLGSAFGTHAKKHDLTYALKKSLKPAMEYYTQVVDEKIHYEAKLGGQELVNPFRHLYKGGDPRNIGDEGKALFKVDYRKLTAGRGEGYELYVRTKYDDAPSVSDATGSERKLEFDERTNRLEFSDDKYPSWKDRAASVYSGDTVGGSRPNGPKYILAADPPRHRYSTKPPKFVVTSESFATDYSAYAKSFKKWYTDEVRVSGFEMIDALDESTENSIYDAVALGRVLAKTYSASRGMSRASGRAAGMSEVEFSGGNNKNKQVYDKVANRVGLRFYREFRKNVKETIMRRMTKVPRSQAQQVSSGFGSASAEWRAEQERLDREKYL